MFVNEKKETISKATKHQNALTLQQFWARQGCVVLQPLDMEVGAGTFHPATFLRSLGPEPWNAAYVQPASGAVTPTRLSVTSTISWDLEPGTDPTAAQIELRVRDLRLLATWPPSAPRQGTGMVELVYACRSAPGGAPDG